MEEIRRVFSIFDVDGNQQLDVEELRKLMGSLNAGIVPGDDEIKMLIAKIDKNNDMMVSFQEFEAGITEWLSESLGGDLQAGWVLPGAGKNDHSPVCFRRRNVHNEISQFFSQFRPRQSVNAKDLVTQDDDDEDWGVSSAALYPELAPETKLERLHFCREYLNNFASLVQGLLSTDLTACASSLQTLVQMLQLTEEFSTTSQRYIISPLLIQLFESVTHANVVQRVVHIISDTEGPAYLRTLGCRALELYVRGPRVAHTPTDSPWHPGLFLTKQIVVQAGALFPLVIMLDGEVHPTHALLPLKAAATRVLAAVGETNPEGLQVLLGLGIRNKLIPLVQCDLPVDHLRSTSYCLAVLCGHTQAVGAAELDTLTWEELLPLLQALAILLNTAEDDQVLANTCAALAHVLPLVSAEQSLGECLLQKVLVLLDISPSGVRGAALPDRISHDRLHAVLCVTTCLRGCIAPHGNIQTDDLALKILELLTIFLESLFKELQLQSILTLEVLVKFGHQIAVLDYRPPLVPKILSIIQDNEVLAGRTIRLLRSLIQFADLAPKQLLQPHTTTVLFHCVTQLRRHDDVLADTYNYLGPAFDVKRVLNSIDCIMGLLSAEEKIRKAGDKCALSLVKDFGMNSLLSIKELVDVMVEETLSGRLLPWMTSDADLKLDKAVDDLLKCMHRAHQELVNQGSSSSQRITAAISETSETMRKRLAEATGTAVPSDGLSRKPFQRPTFISTAFRHIVRDGQDVIPPSPFSLTKEMSYVNHLPDLAREMSGVDLNISDLPPVGIEFSKQMSELPELMREDSRASPHGTATQSMPPPPTKAQVLQSDLCKLTITPLNFDKVIRLQVPRMIDWRELVRHCTVIAGRTVELSFMYMGEVATNLPIDSQESLQLALSRSDKHGQCMLYMKAKYTEEYTAAASQGNPLPSVNCITAEFDRIMVPEAPPLPTLGNDRKPEPPSNNGLNQPQSPPARSLNFSDAQENSLDYQNLQEPPRKFQVVRAASFQAHQQRDLSEKKKKLEKTVQYMRQKWGVDVSMIDVCQASRYFKKFNTEVLNKEQFFSILAAEGLQDPCTQQQLFDAFDDNRDGVITSKEFLIGFAIMRRGSMEDRLKMAFHAFDTDGSGFIDYNEMIVLVASTLGLSQEDSRVRAQAIFERWDADRNGVIDYAEFKAAVLEDQHLLNSFWIQGMSSPDPLDSL